MITAMDKDVGKDVIRLAGRSRAIRGGLGSMAASQS
jgi:hypothetical protein